MTGRGNARGRRTIAAIEHAALTAADELGAPAVTVREICARAGTSERVFFNHFATREDAFLGREQPTVDEDWAACYIGGSGVSLTLGAARLVLLPPVDPEVQEQRLRLIAHDPQLLARTYALLEPVRERCREIVAAAARHRHPHLSHAQQASLARVIVAVAAEIITDPEAPSILSVLRADLDVLGGSDR